MRYALLAGLCLAGSSLQCDIGDKPEAPVYNPVIDPAAFVAVINNPYCPFLDSMVWTCTGTGALAGEVVHTRVTKQKKIMMGVTCTEITDSGFVNGKLEEATTDWVAQDTAGNVWYFGESVKEFDTNGVIISTDGSWEAGQNDALPGIMMPGHPRVGDTYRIEYAEDVAQDQMQILGMTDSTTVPFGTYHDCIVTSNWSDIEPGTLEYKYYAAGIGCVRIDQVEGPAASELLTDYHKE